MQDHTFLLLGGLLFLLAWWSHRQRSRAVKPWPYPKPLESYPSVTIIRPIKGLDVEVEENVRVGLDTGYDGEVQTLFVFDDEREPALPLVRKVVEEHERSGRPGTAEIFFCGQPPANRTGKLNAMIEALALAKGELVGFVDSDLRTDDEVLRVTVETLSSDAKIGCAFAPVVFWSKPRSLGDAITKILPNGLYTPSALVYAERKDRHFPFILGQFMVFRRKALEAIGGLESTEGQLCDDLYIGQLTHAAGWKNVMAPHWVRIIHYGCGLRESYAIYLRWLTFSRTGLPDFSFVLHVGIPVLLFWAGEWGGLAFAATGQWLNALVYAALAAAVTASVNSFHSKIGGEPMRPRHWWGAAVMLTLLPWVLFKVHVLQNRVVWRGRVYGLDASAKLNIEPEGGQAA